MSTMCDRVAFITGITGQDGSYLSELLLSKGYFVYGIVRRKANPEFATANIDHLEGKYETMTLLHGDITDSGNLVNVFQQIQFKHANRLEILEVYNLAALSHVKVSFECPEYCMMVNAVGTLKLLEVIRAMSEETRAKVRFYQASTSELYGEVLERPQSETTQFNPVSPYACSKLAGFYLVKNYRDGFGIHASNGILFNHESPRRGMDFISRKVTVGISKILKGFETVLTVGNLDSIRDWGHARDYVEGMWKMMQAEKPDDYVLATGEIHSVREFIEIAFGRVGIVINWRGSGLDEQGFDESSGRVYVTVSKKYFRPLEVSFLQGDARKALACLGWAPKTTFLELVKEMVDHDCKGCI